MGEIIDYIPCEACNAKGEHDNLEFQRKTPEERLRLLEAGEVGVSMEAHFKCPFCTDGQQPVFECEECEGDGCYCCNGEGWYL